MLLIILPRLNKFFLKLNTSKSTVLLVYLKTFWHFNVNLSFTYFFCSFLFLTTAQPFFLTYFFQYGMSYDNLYVTTSYFWWHRYIIAVTPKSTLVTPYFHSSRRFC